MIIALASNGRARRLAWLNLALLVALVPSDIASTHSSPRASLDELETRPRDSKQDTPGLIEPEGVWIDAFDMNVCGRAKLRPWQEEQSAFGCAESGQRDESERGNIAPRILGGEFAQEDEFPSFVHLNITGRFGCGATLIDRNLAVTAAHCVADTENRTLIFGSNWLNGTGGEVREADRVCHPSKYVRPMDGFPIYDLAIIRFKGSISYSSKISPACLNLDSRPSEQTTCSFAGLGWTLNLVPATNPRRLKTLKVKRSCKERHNDQSCYMTPGGIDDGLQVTHLEDIGSPVICYERCGLNNSIDQVRAFAVGTNSWGSKDYGEPTLERLENHVADFHGLKSSFLELLQAIRGEGNESTDGVICKVPHWVKPPA